MTDNKGQVWLIRDHTNVVRGPYSQHEVLHLIKKGQLKGKTEICQANSYWFTLDEKIEVAKFFPEMKLKTPDQPTQMTSTLTQADLGEHPLEGTQVVAAPKAPEKPAEENAPIQWLSDEFADEFGDDPTMAGMNPLESSTVKADTLPSEHKDYKGERPTPLGSLGKNKEKSAAPNIVQVPVEKLEAAKILDLPDSPPASSGTKPIKLLAGLVIAAVIGFGALYVLRGGMGPGTKGPVTNQSARASLGSPEANLRRAFLLFDLEDAKALLAQLQLDAANKGKVFVAVSEALLKKEFLYDTDGAITGLQGVHTEAQEPATVAEIDNLMAVYRFDRDQKEAVEELKRVVERQSGEAVFRYNLALAQMRMGNPREAAAQLGRLGSSGALAAEVALLAAWARDAQTKGADPAIEAAYLKALEDDPLSAKARLGLAIYRLRKNGPRAADADFRAFIDLAPDLDPPSRVVNYRRMSDFDFYSFARSQLRELNIPGGAAGAKPSPVIMAVDAILSCMQSRTGEAGKILEVALSSAPGDPSILKAMGYHRFKEGRHAEVIDLLQEQVKEKGGFAFHFLIGKASLKIGRRDEARRNFEALSMMQPARSEGWALLGEILLKQGKADEARKNFGNALQRNPNDLQALRGMDQLGDSSALTPELAGNLPF